MATQINRNPASSASAGARDEDHEALEREQDRRRWLAITDQLLNELEELNLRERRTVPAALQSRILAAYGTLAGSRREPKVTSPTRAHDAVLSLQAPLLARNPRCPSPSTYPRRSAGQPTRFTTGNGVSWKALSLPPIPADGIDDAWLELALLTVERAFDRWAWAQHHAARAAASGESAGPATARLMAAWANYWELVSEVERLTGQVEQR